MDDGSNLEFNFPAKLHRDPKMTRQFLFRLSIPYRILRANPQPLETVMIKTLKKVRNQLILKKNRSFSDSRCEFHLAKGHASGEGHD